MLKGDDTIVAAPDGAVAVNPLAAPMLATAGTGDVLSGVIGALLAKGMDPFAAAAAGVRLHAAAGRLAGERVGPDGVIAGDVAAALPGVLRRVMPTRALARVDLGAITANTARMRRELHGAQLCAVVKADGYGHGAVPAASAALAGGATWLAVAAAHEARELRDAGIDDIPILVLGALSPEELDVALAARADVAVWREETVMAVAARGGGRVHVKLDSGMGRLGTRDAGAALRVAALADAEAGVELVGAMTHFATADEPGDAFFGEQLARFTPWAAADARRAPADRRPRRQQRRDAARPRQPLRSRAHRCRALRPGPVRRGSRAARPAPGAGAVVLGRRGEADRAGGERGVRAAVRRRAGPRTWRRCRSATATAFAARSRTTPTCSCAGGGWRSWAP